MRGFLVALVCAVWASAISVAQTLEIAIEKATENNPEIEGQRRLVDAAREQFKVAKAGRNPRVTLSAEYGYRTSDTISQDLILTNDTITIEGFRFEADNDFEQMNVGAQASMDLYAGGRIKGGIIRSEADLRAAETVLELAERRLVRDVTVAYLDVFRDQKVLSLAQETLAVALGRRDQERRRFELGERTESDLMRAEARFAGAQLETSEAEALLEISRNRYRQLIGEPPAHLAFAVPPLGMPASQREAIEKALATSLRIENAIEARVSAEAGVTIAKSAQRPNLSLDSAVLYTEGGTDFIDERTDAVIGLRLTVPFYDGGRTSGRVRAARALAREAAFRQEAERRVVERTARDAFIRYQQSQATIRYASQVLSATEKATEIARREFEFGMRTDLDLLEIERDLSEARVSVIRSERNGHVAALDLLLAVGDPL